MNGAGALALADQLSPRPSAGGRGEEQEEDALERAIAATVRPHGALGRDQKAAIILRLLRDADQTLPLADFDEGATVRLVQALASLHYVDGPTILAVISEFLEALETSGLYFRPGIDGALETLANDVSDAVRQRLEGVQAAGRTPPDPWQQIATRTPEDLMALLSQQTPQVTAVVLAKLPAITAAEILAALETPVADAVAIATARSGQLDPRTVAEIGAALAASRKNDASQGGLPGSATERIGAILNFTPGARREELLASLERDDPDMADRIRRTMFTFADIPDRVEVKDVAKLVRAVDNDTMVLALAAAEITDKDSSAFILGNLSKRLAEQLRDAINEVGEVKQKEADKAMNAVIQSIRDLEAAGKLTLITDEE